MTLSTSIRIVLPAARNILQAARNIFRATRILLPASLLFSACHSSTTSEPAPTTDTPVAERRNLPALKHNPETREHVKKEAITEYKVKTDNKLNDLYFAVRLYETQQTMKYLAKVEYEGLTGEDTVTLPDIGIPPHPVLQKGPEKYSCIIGLLDNNNAFRELKKVYVTPDGSELKIKNLKHYIVTEGYRLVPE
ncbi:MAG TPA: hypothetical protein VNW04_16065 [Puia sp.]|nr:hypothetical protein [Puia sp.]